MYLTKILEAEHAEKIVRLARLEVHARDWRLEY